MHSQSFAELTRRVMDSKTKPLGSLGRLETLAVQIGTVQRSTAPRMDACSLTIFAGDHGIVAEGVSAYPQAVTRQMVLNFLEGGAAANALAAALDVGVRVVDAGTAGEPLDHAGLLQHRLAPGTRNSAVEPAMAPEDVTRGLELGRALGGNAEGQAACFGEMGIGNSSAAALLAHKLTGLPLEELVGRGTGLDDAGLRHKRHVLARAGARTPPRLRAADALRHYGGHEIVMMAGAMLGAAAAGKIVIVDGFIASSAATAALDLDADVRPHFVFAHRSAERGHASVLEWLKAEPLLDLGMRLGEGTGALLAWPIVKSAAAVLRDMATFEQAGVSGPA
jgi:nicotinate-nucleotide--dimethylbenzimidazole phosphoribosyltransferase